MSSPTPLELASALAARLAHDVMSPANGIVSAFDLMADPGAAGLREEAIALAAESARSLMRLLTVQRILYAGLEPAPEALEETARSLFAGARASLTLTLQPLAPGAASVLLGLLQIAREAAASGGTVEAGSGGEAVRIVVAGPRVKLADEVRAGLAGRDAEGQRNRWVGAFMLNAMTERAGGWIQVEDYDGGLTLTARMAPATDRAEASPASS